MQLCCISLAHSIRQAAGSWPSAGAERAHPSGVPRGVLAGRTMVRSAGVGQALRTYRTANPSGRLAAGLQPTTHSYSPIQKYRF